MQKTINACSLVEFVQKIQEEARQGWEIDFEDNDSIPHGGMGFYRCRVNKGKRVAALLSPPPTSESAYHATTDDFTEHCEPFVPSIIFSAEQQPVVVPKKSGRSRASSI